MGLGLSLVALWGAMACDAPAYSIFVDLRTDLLPGVEIVGAQTTLREPNRTQSAVLTATDDLFAGLRIAELTSVPSGERVLEVDLLAADGRVVASRVNRLTLEGDIGITTVIARDCTTVRCDEGETCAGGECVPDTCNEMLMRPECGPPECDVDADCPTPTATCAESVCDLGICFDVPVDGGCSASELCNPDAGCQPIQGACRAPDALFCDGFEDTDLPGWTRNEPDGVVAPETTIVFRDDRSVRFSLETAGGMVSLERPLLAGVTEGELWTTLMVFVPDTETVTAIGLVIQRDSTSSEFLSFGFWEVGLRARDEADFSQTSSARPSGRWFCLELRHELGDGGIAEVFVDGESRLTHTKLGTAAGGYGLLDLGIAFTVSDQPPTDLYVDELLVTRSRAGCP